MVILTNIKHMKKRIILAVLAVLGVVMAIDACTSAQLKAYTVTNLLLTYALPIKNSNIPDITLKCQCNNLFNTKYVNNGGTDGTYVWYFPQAGINVHAGFVVQW